MNDPPHFEAKSLAQKPGTSDFVENGVPWEEGIKWGYSEGVKAEADVKDWRGALTGFMGTSVNLR